MTEIERKFLVDRPPAGLGTGSSIRQGYLAVDGEVEVRIRAIDDRCVLTVKGGRGLERTEVETDLDPEGFAQLWPLTAGRQVAKTRARLDLGGGAVAEVDRFEGALAGLVLVEVEFPTVAAADGFEPPNWFGRDLTGEPGWSNADLARHGRPPG